jgi:hypothetical protein
MYATGHQALDLSKCFARCNTCSQLPAVCGMAMRSPGAQDVRIGVAIFQIRHTAGNYHVLWCWLRNYRGSRNQYLGLAVRLSFLVVPTFLVRTYIFHHLVILWLHSHPRTFYLRVKHESCMSFPE